MSTSSKVPEDIREESNLPRTGEIERERLRGQVEPTVPKQYATTHETVPQEKILPYESLPSSQTISSQVPVQAVPPQQHIPSRITTTQVESQIYAPQQQFVPYVSQYPQQYSNVVADPTIQLFNRLVAKDTHCLLGRTGVKVSRICLGSLNFGKIDKRFGDRPGQLDEDEAHKILDRYVELGGNCIDTADFFPWFGASTGEAETIIGNWLQR